MTVQTVRDRILILIKLLADDTKSRLAEMLEVTPTNIDDWVNKGYAPQREQLLKFYDKLNINLNWLLTGDGEMFNKHATAGIKQGEKRPLMGHEALAEYGYDKEEREYIDKLIKIFRTKDAGTKSAIMQNIDTFMKVPEEQTMEKIKKAG